MTKLYRVILYVLDLNDSHQTKESVKQELESIRYPEFVKALEVRETSCGEWTDDHPLNKTAANMAVFDSYFAELDTTDEKDPWFKQEHQRVRGIMLAQIQKNSHLEQEVMRLKAEVAGLQKVRDFVNTVKDLTK